MQPLQLTTGTIILNLAIVFAGGVSAGAQITDAPSKVALQNVNYREADRFEVYRDGGHRYVTDGYGADLLRQAIIDGYRQGFAAGGTDRTAARRSNCSRSDIYRDADYGYEKKRVDRGQYKYYFRESFELGYQDGFTGRSDYGYTQSGQRQVFVSVVNDLMTVVTSQ